MVTIEAAFTISRNNFGYENGGNKIVFNQDYTCFENYNF